MPPILFTLTSTQSFIYNKETCNITCPTPGSKLYRITKKTRTTEIYVVTKIYKKEQGQNRGVVDKILLHLVSEDIGDKLEYDPGKTIILHLTNHGKWWTNQLRKEYIFSWNQPPSRVSSIRKTVSKLLRPLRPKVKPIRLIPIK